MLDLTHLLFGSVLAVDDLALTLMAGVATLVLPVLAVIWRPLVLESFDPDFLRAEAGNGGVIHGVFLTLVVLVVVAGFTALGTLMSVGLMMLPAIAGRHWGETLPAQVIAAVAIAVLSAICGLLLSYHADLPAGPAIVLTAGGFWLVGLLAGPQQSLLRRLAHRAHPA